MSKELAIVGHPERGDEVIKLLEMMGGRDVGVLKGNHDYYVIDECENNLIKFYGHDYIYCHEFVVLTLEEFLEKYPFKVGDKVVYTKFGDNCDDYPLIIKSMKWTGTTIEYTFDGYVTCLAKDLKMWNEEPNAVISGIYLNSCDYADEVELNLGDYEIEVRDGRTFAVLKKPKYPKTYEECCRIVNANPYIRLIYDLSNGQRYSYDADNLQLYEKIRRLLICRDAYWKIYGEEMGLGKPWEPDWTNYNEYKFVIGVNENKIIKCYNTIAQFVLAFPTEKMRDAFYKNFKDLIEQCKELL